MGVGLDSQSLSIFKNNFKVMNDRLPIKYLVLQHNDYDASSIYGIFDTREEAGAAIDEIINGMMSTLSSIKDDNDAKLRREQLEKDMAN
jgi:regulatory protein YycH of two-component signal transduction system YycFG